MDRKLADRIARSEFAAVARVAAVVDDLDGARVVADGRAPNLPKYNHAALLRTTPDDADRVIEKVAAFFRKRNRTPGIVLDPSAEPVDFAARLADAGWSLAETQDLLLWDPDARHIYTDPHVYMTLCTNATLERWLELYTGELEGVVREQAAKMLTLEFRAAGTWFWFAQYDGTPVTACALTVGDGVGRVGPVRTEPESRRKGCGLAAVNYCTRQSRKDGADTTFGFSDPGGPAIGLCATSGYSVAVAGARQLWHLVQSQPQRDTEEEETVSS